MELSPDQLESHGYVVIDILKHKELIYFIKDALGKKTLASRWYHYVLMGMLGLLTALVVTYLTEDRVEVDWTVASIGYGVIGAFLLVPLHEWLHVVAYRSQGARKTSYDVDWKRLVFMAIADRFVANRSEFRIIALTPFVTIGLMLFLGVVVSALTGFTYWAIGLAAMLLTHSAFCGGDFGLLSYMEYHGDQEMVTWDDRDNSTTYFLARPLQAQPSAS